MTTAEALEGISDFGQYEILATRALRVLEPDCRAVAHFGVNAQGKPIPNPVDGFCLVPGSSPPRYVMTAFATTGRDKLERKWLFDHATSPNAKKATAADDGDLIKAAKQAEAIRATDPIATFVVYLCTNRRLDADIMTAVYHKAAELGVTARLFDQSELRDLLDTKSEGQWLRKEHLGIDADQLSLPLLKQLSKMSQELYAAEILLPIRTEIIRTEQLGALQRALRDPHKPLRILVGASGAGKSVLAHELLGSALREEGIGLWIPSEIAERSVSLANVIDQTLRSIYPSLAEGAGEAALKLSTPDQPLLLALDDINRFRDPRRLLEKAVSWMRPLTPSAGDGDPSPSPVRLLCPVWDSLWHLLKFSFESFTWLLVHPVNRMNRDESVACIRCILREHPSRFSDTDLGTYAERMGDDPILLALFGRLLSEIPGTNPMDLSSDVIGQFVNKFVGELSMQRGLAPAEYLSALDSVSEAMISRKRLYPEWSTIQGWLGGHQRQIDALSHLATQGQICRLSDRSGSDRFEFRHDRILEYFLSNATFRLLAADGPGREVLKDPYFVGLVGSSIARNGTSANALEWVNANQPVALVAALPYLPFGPSDHAERVVSLARDWLNSAKRPGSEAMLYHARSLLLAADSAHVLRATEGIDDDFYIAQSRLRNGDVVAGINVMVQYPRFSPGIHDAQLETMISQAVHRRGAKLIQELGLILRSDPLEDVHRTGALTLAGYVASERLGDDVRNAWERISDKGRSLLAGLWAALRCSADDPAAALDPMLAALTKVSNEPSQYDQSERQRIAENLALTTRHGFPERVLDYLVLNQA